MAQILDLQMSAYVSIAGKEVNFVSLEIEQCYGEHHRFNIQLDSDFLMKQFYDPGKQIDLIGERLYVEIYPQNKSSEDIIFRGIITKVSLVGKDGRHGYIQLSGESPTVLLDKGKRFDTYSSIELNHVFKILLELPSNLRISSKIKTRASGNVDFLMQYNETDWDFMRRICYLYGEDIFFTGDHLRIGDCTDEDFGTTTLMYDREITTLDFIGRLLPNRFINYSYDYTQDYITKQNASDSLKSDISFVKKAFDKNIILSQCENGKEDYPMSLLSTTDVNTRDVLELTKRKQARNAAETICVVGTAKVHYATIGRKISIEMPSTMGGSILGTYRVYKSRHLFDNTGRYTNYFEAAPADLIAMPMTEPNMPIANSLLATVVRNTDPRNLGRVSVYFDFERRHFDDIWLRVMSPNAGLTSDKSKNRGMIFIPEKGDQVMVNFEYGDPNRPYVQGSMFHSNNGEGGGENNGIKSFITTNGIRIVLNDNTRSVNIEEPSGNKWYMDGKGNISVDAPNSLTINTKNIELNVSNNIAVNAGKNLLTNVGNVYHIFADSTKSVISRKAEMYSEDTLLSTKNKMHMQSQEMVAMGMQKMSIHSDKTITANSLGRMSLKSSKAMALSEKAEKAELANHEEITLAVVQLRLNESNYGEIGFDYFILKGEEKGIAFENSIDGGVQSVTIQNKIKTVNEYGSTADALTALKQKYDPIPIVRTIAATTGQETDYYVPRMTIFSEKTDTSYAYSSSLPKSSVTLDVWIEILAEIEKVELDYNKKYFDISEINLSSKTPCNKQKSGSITFTCKEEFSKKQEIIVWAYPKKQEGESSSKDDPKYLAGKLIVHPNDVTRRKKRNVILVSVKTDWRNTGIVDRFQEGKLKEIAQDYLQAVFNQSLIEGSLIMHPDMASIPQSEKDQNIDYFCLDLSTNAEFQVRISSTDPVTPTYQFGRFIYNPDNPLHQHNGNAYGNLGLFILKHDPIPGSTERNLQPNKDLYVYLRQLFDKKYPRYKDTMAVFVFDMNTNNRDLAGLALGINKNSALVFGDYAGNAPVHEVYHLLGLHHSFRNDASKPLEAEQQFVYKRGFTNNIMDYDTSPAVGCNTWEWQWLVVNQRLKV